MDDNKPAPASPEEPAVPQPGSMIVPAGAPRAAEDRVSVLPEQLSPAPVPQPSPPKQPEPPEQAPEPIPFPEDAQLRPGQRPDPNAIVWTASEFIAHEKSSNWYLAILGVTLAIAGLITLLTKDIISVVVVLVCGLTFGFYGSRQPRQVEYQIDSQGISIGRKFLPYDGFRSFAIVEDGAFSSITLMPLKRFAVQATIYYAPDDEDRIIETLADYLPVEEHKIDAIDRLMRRIRF